MLMLGAEMHVLLLILIHHCPLFLCVQTPDELFETTSQALLNAVDRDALSGWGAVVHLM